MLSGKRKQNDHRSSLHHIYVFSHVNRVLVVDVPRSTLVTTLLQWAYISLGLIAGTDKPRCWGTHFRAVVFQIFETQLQVRR